MRTQRFSGIGLLALLILVVPVVLPLKTYSAPGLNNRSIQLGTSEASASTSYDFKFDIALAGNLGSIRFEFCSNNPLPFIACTAPTGFDISGATLIGQTGETGFSINPGATANDILLTRVPVVAIPQTVTYTFSNVINPDTGPTTYYVRLYTFASSDGSGATTEEAGLAFAIVDLFDVTAYVPPFLEFCVGISITAQNCTTATGDLIDFGTLSPATTSAGTSQMAGATNGVGGYAISVIGTTMTSGINTITGLSIRSSADPGTSQFGINLRANSNPSVGLNPAGPGTAVPVGDYSVSDEFTFRSGDVIASSPLSTNYDTLTVSYIVNVSDTQKPGVYTSTLTYVATATF